MTCKLKKVFQQRHNKHWCFNTTQCSTPYSDTVQYWQPRQLYIYTDKHAKMVHPIEDKQLMIAVDEDICI